MPMNSNDFLSLVPELRLRSMLAATNSGPGTPGSQGIFFLESIKSEARNQHGRPDEQSPSWWPFAPLLRALLEDETNSHALWVAFGRHSRSGDGARRSWSYFLSEAISKESLEDRDFRNRLARFILLLSFPSAYPEKAESLLLGRANLTDHESVNGRAVLATSQDLSAHKEQMHNLDRYLICLQIPKYIANLTKPRLTELTRGEDEDDIADKILEISGVNSNSVNTLRFLSTHEIEAGIGATTFAETYESRLSDINSEETMMARDLDRPSNLRLARYFAWVHDFALDDFIEILNIPLWHRASSAGESGSLILVLRKAHKLNLLNFNASTFFSLGEDFNALIAAVASANSEIIASSGQHVGRVQQEHTESQRLAHDILSLLAMLEIGTSSNYLNRWTLLLLADRARCEHLVLQPLASPGEALTRESQEECMQVAVIHGIERLRHDASRKEARLQISCDDSQIALGVRELLDELQDSPKQVETVFSRILGDDLVFEDLPSSVWTPYIRYFIWGAARQAIYHALRASCILDGRPRGFFGASLSWTSCETDQNRRKLRFTTWNQSINRFAAETSHDFETLQSLVSKLQEAGGTKSQVANFSWKVETLSDLAIIESKIVLEIGEQLFERG